MDTAVVTEADLLDISEDLKTYTESLISDQLAPIVTKLTDMFKTLADVSVTASSLLDQATSLQKDVKLLQQSDQATREKIAFMDHKELFI